MVAAVYEVTDFESGRQFLAELPDRQKKLFTDRFEQIVDAIRIKAEALCGEAMTESEAYDTATDIAHEVAIQFLDVTREQLSIAEAEQPIIPEMLYEMATGLVALNIILIPEERASA